MQEFAIYRCVAEGHEPHYATYQGALASIEALRQSSEDYASVTLADICQLLPPKGGSL